MKSAFLLQHLHVIAEDNDCVKVIGLYASKEDALGAIERLASQPGFSGCPKLIDPLEDDEESGFYIDEYEIGKDHWSEGYVTV
ncbi:DUF7336 domain-containing protein [Microbulbifer variabilis]|uniref:DUF7336 domain-containing protein n=1 Tax=Microbulbifer variabilis TaxID=266805 RepID=UPI0003731198|nr:hypothetical protein [Microbulbifer variabilis]